MSQARVISDVVRQLENESAEFERQRDAAVDELEKLKIELAVQISENINLRKVINRANSKAKHYMNQHAGLGAGISHLSAVLIDLINRHRAHAYTDGIAVSTTPPGEAQRVPVQPLRAVS